MKRLSAIAGEWIDRRQPLGFEFEGQSYQGFAGDTVSSALWANGQHVLARSFKYHRPRGVLSFANHDANVIMQAGAQLNLRADVVPVAPGMKLTAVNTFGGVAGDKARLLGHFSRFLPVGFYYKSFHSKKLFPLWERLFRTLTGLGKVDLSAPHERTAKRYDFCDVLVVGAGPSGLSAALAAAAQGAEVVVVDENAQAGGSGTYEGASDAGRRQVTVDLLEKVKNTPSIRLMTRTLAAGYYTDHWIPLVTDEYLIKMRARSVVVASGAYEQPAVFRNNDLPGVMLASAAQRLLFRYAVAPGASVVVLAANVAAYRAALDMRTQGIQVVAVVDLRQTLREDACVAAVRAAGIAVRKGSMILEALPAAGGLGVQGVKVAPLDAKGEAQNALAETLACDAVLMSVGYAPTANLLYQAGTKMRFDEALQQFVPATLPEGVFACGRVNGVYTLASKLFDGQRAGSAAAAAAGLGQALAVDVPPEAEMPSHPWPIVSHPQGKNFVDFDEDLQFQDFENAVQEGFDNIELLKRFSTVGMGPSQGKHSNMNALRILARLTGKTPQQVGTTTARPFFHPVPMALLGGRGFNPHRDTPLQSRHEACGAVWMPAGVWSRPAYYRHSAPSAEAQDCIRAEAMAVRQGVGVIDVGTLGKLEIFGPQAAEFLERVYISRYANLKVGMTRYAVMCDEAGVVIDDGVVARLAEDHFYFTTTTSGAATIYRELSRLNTMWRLDCGIVNHTGAFAAINLTGPKSRAVLASLTALDLSAAAFPYLAVQETRLNLPGGAVPARLMRVGFVGEWGYEIHVPASAGAALWDAVMAAGKTEGIRPFGVEAQRLLRLEKGHIIIGQDTDGLTTPLEVGLGWALKMDKPFFVGQRSLQVLSQQALRQSLVGFMLPDGYTGTVPQECHLIIDTPHASPALAGRITSIAWSPSLKRHVGLAFIRPDLSAVGTPFQIRLTDGRLVQATVCATPFYDPNNLKQKEGA